MPKNFSDQIVSKDEWKEFKIISLIFLGIVLTGSILLMTTIPKTTIIWSSFIAGMIIPVVIFYLRERHKKRYNKVELNESSTAFIPGQSISGYISYIGPGPILGDIQQFYKGSLFEKNSSLVSWISIENKINAGTVLPNFSHHKKKQVDQMQELSHQISRPYFIRQRENTWIPEFIQETFPRETRHSFPQFSVLRPAQMPLKDFNPISITKVAM